jgi:hypothetical protein
MQGVAAVSRVDEGVWTGLGVDEGVWTGLGVDEGVWTGLGVDNLRSRASSEAPSARTPVAVDLARGSVFEVPTPPATPKTTVSTRFRARRRTFPCSAG